MSATLTILGDASGVRRALGDVVTETRRAAEASNASARRAADQRRRLEAEEIASARAALRSMQRDRRAAIDAEITEARAELRTLNQMRQRAARERMRVEAAAQRERERDRRAAAAREAREEREQTRKHDREERERSANARREQATRTRDAQREQSKREREERDATRKHEREEKERTRTTEREERRRTRLAEQEARKRARAENAARREDRATGRQVGRMIGQNATGIASGVSGYATDIHAQVQAARQGRAATAHTLNGAFYQAGIDGAEGDAMRATLQREVASGSLRGMSMDEIAAGLAEAQTQFSVLSGRDPAQRQAAFQDQLQLLAFARNTYQDPGNVLRVGGMLRGQNIQGEDRMTLIRALTGLGQEGSVELSDVVSQGLGSLMGNIAVATSQLRPGATAEERARVVQAATARTVAVSQVAARGGMTVRDSMNALRKADEGLASTRTADNFRAGLRARGFTDAQIGTVLATERDPRTGRTVNRFRSRDTTQVFDQITTLFNGDTTAASNFLRGGGHGTPQVFDAQVRRLYNTLGSQRGQGTVSGAVEDIARRGRQFGADDERRGRDMRNREDATGLQANAETGANALTDRSRRDVRASNAVADAAARNPFEAAAVQQAAGVLGGILGPAVERGMERAVERLLGGSRGVPAAGPLGAPAPGGLATPAVAVPAAAGGLGFVGSALVTGGVLSMLAAARTALTGNELGGERASTAERVNAGLSALTPGAAIGEVLRQAVVAGFASLREQPLRATIDPHDAQHVNTQNATPRGGRR